MGTYYDGTKLLSMMDKDGNRPEIYLCTTNRTGGKTTFFSRLCVKRFREGKGKFMLVYRFKNELSNVAEKFFKDINGLFFPDSTMTEKVRARGQYVELFLDNASCGYAVALNCADSLKKFSHLFSDVERMFMDEFQSETNHYCSEETNKFISLHTTVARGQGKQYRYVPVYMCGNPVTILNPYYVALGVCDLLRSDMKFIKGHGFVLEQGYVQSAGDAQEQSGVLKAMASSNYVAYNKQGIYLNDSRVFIEPPPATSVNNYICTIRHNGADYAIREFPKLAMLYCDTSVDPGYPIKIAVTTEDHQINYVMLNKYKFMIHNLRYFFDNGCFRFRNQRAKQAILDMLSY